VSGLELASNPARPQVVEHAPSPVAQGTGQTERERALRIGNADDVVVYATDCVGRESPVPEQLREDHIPHAEAESREIHASQRLQKVIVAATPADRA